MKLTTRGRYAVTAMLDLAIHGDRQPITLADISQRQEISLSYLEQLFSKLRREDLVRSIRGLVVVISWPGVSRRFSSLKLLMQLTSRLMRPTAKAEGLQPW